MLNPQTVQLPEAVVFIGFRHKRQGLQAAKKLGVQTILMTRDNAEEAKELFDEVLVGEIASPAFMAESAAFLKKKYQIKGVVSNYEHYVVMRTYLAQQLGVPTASLKAAAHSRNKALQREALKDFPFNIDFKAVSSLAEAKAAFYELGEDVFLKSIAGIKSRMVFHVESEAELEEAFEQFESLTDDAQEGLYYRYNDYLFDFKYPDPTKVFLVEKAEYGQQVTTSSFVGESKVWHSPSVCDVYSASHLGRKDSFLAFRILPSRFDKKTTLAVEQCVEKTVEKIQLKHCSLFFDFLIKKNGEVKLIELASRMGGYRPLMYHTAYDLDLNELLVKNAMGEEMDSKENDSAKKYVSLIEIFAESEGILDFIEDLDALQSDPCVSALRVLKKKGDKVGLAKNGFEPCLSFLVEGESYEQVYELSMDYCKRLKVRIG